MWVGLSFVEDGWKMYENRSYMLEKVNGYKWCMYFDRCKIFKYYCFLFVCFCNLYIKEGKIENNFYLNFFRIIL